VGGHPAILLFVIWTIENAILFLAALREIK
jgi:hypothetical protein